MREGEGQVAKQMWLVDRGAGLKAMQIHHLLTAHAVLHSLSALPPCPVLCSSCPVLSALLSPTTLPNLHFFNSCSAPMSLWWATASTSTSASAACPTLLHSRRRPMQEMTATESSCSFKHLQHECGCCVTHQCEASVAVLLLCVTVQPMPYRAVLWPGWRAGG